MAQRGAKGLEAEIIRAAGPLGAIQKSSDIHQLGARFHKIKVQHLLACHGFHIKSNSIAVYNAGGQLATTVNDRLL